MNPTHKMNFGVVLTTFVLIGSVSTASSFKTMDRSSVIEDGRMLYVGGSGPGNYSKIQDAVNNASDGDTVFVYDDSSPYWENIAINVSIRLIGENRNTTSIEGGHYAISIYGDGVSVSGFTIRNVGDFWNCCGFYVISDDNNISCNTIADNLRMNGIFLEGSSYNRIYGNIIQNNNYHGIRLESSSHNMIADNVIVNNRGFGIYLAESTDNYIMGNTVKQNSLGGLTISTDCGNNIIFHNNFVSNLQNAYDETGNTWDNGSSGNYWDDYTGSDCDGDGIGDLPYQIPGNASHDYYPLMKPYGLEEPTLKITITGGFGVTVSVKNAGNEEVTNVDWRICLEGGLLLLPLERCHNGTIPRLAAGEELVIQPAGLFFGVGRMAVNVTVEDATAVMKGFLLPFFFIPTS